MVENMVHRAGEAAGGEHKAFENFSDVHILS